MAGARTALTAAVIGLLTATGCSASASRGLRRSRQAASRPSATAIPDHGPPPAESGFPAPPPPTANVGLPPVVNHVATGDPVVFVTIDDGWTKDPAVLPFLAAHRLWVTAFLIGRLALREPDYWQSLVGQGGVVEDHTETHPALARRPLAAQRDQICGPLDDDQRLFGRRPTLFRPPYGSMDTNTVVAAGQCGLSTVVLWDVTVDRGRMRRATPGPLRPGDIVLLHWGPGLAADLRVLVGILDRSGLHSALLENYLPPRAAAGAGPVPPPTSAPQAAPPPAGSTR